MVLEGLRKATRPQHEALEAIVPLGEAALSLQLYGQVLTRFHGFYAAWEAAAHDAVSPSLAPILQARRKLPLLEHDLQALGFSSATGEAMDRAWLPDMSASDATLLGSMYVVEGATLGGQVISRSLERSSCFRDGHGYSFFQSYGKATGQQWKAFVALLESLPEQDEPAVIEAAQATFRAFHQWFSLAPFAMQSAGV